MTNTPKIILASTSIYRKEQLERLNIEFDCLPPNVDEKTLKNQNITPIELSKTLALCKAKAAYMGNSNAIVIGGDQVVSFNHSILSKPKTHQRALEQLRVLAGNTHQLITSLAIVYKGQEYVYTCIATMKMRSLTDEQIKKYIATDNPLQCCGSYRLEALGISLFETIECDDYTSIIGIPLMWTAKMLSQLGVSVP